MLEQRGSDNSASDHPDMTSAAYHGCGSFLHLHVFQIESTPILYKVSESSLLAISAAVRQNQPITCVPSSTSNPRATM